MNALDRFLGIVKELLPIESVESTKNNDTGFMIKDNSEWILKDGASEEPVKNGLSIIKGNNGRYKWLAVYSNSFRDDDLVPEIISAKSHKEFVDGVDAGIFDYPDLYLWHVPEWKFGKATFVAYDEVEPGVVFAIAGGDIDKGKEFVAEALLESGIQWQMSHGMPTGSISRYVEDATIYAKYSSTELTVLPEVYAANHLTGFGVLEDNMIPNKKRTEIMDKLGVTGEQLDSLEASNKNVADNEKSVREFKEAADTAISDEEQVSDTPQKDAEAETLVDGNTLDVVIDESITTPADVVVDDLDVSNDTTIVEEVVEEVVEDTPSGEMDLQALVSAFSKQLDAITADISGIKEVVVGTVSALEEFKSKTDEINSRIDGIDKAANDEVVVQTPLFSEIYGQRIKSIIGDVGAVVESDDKLTGPEEKSAGVVTDRFGSFVGELVANSKMTQ